MSLAVKMLLVAVVLLATIGLSRWVPRHPRWRVVVIILNLAITSRYMWWRASETLNWETPAGMTVSIIVYLAEVLNNRMFCSSYIWH